MAPPSRRILLMENIKDFFNSSPYYRHIQMRVQGFTENGCIMTMQVDHQHTNLYGIAHGGAIASIADSVCGLSLAVVLKKDEYTLTQHLTISYLKPVGIGLLRAEGRVLKRGKHSAVLEADVYDESGDKVAHAHTIHSIMKRTDARPGMSIPTANDLKRENNRD